MQNGIRKIPEEIVFLYIAVHSTHSTFGSQNSGALEQLLLTLHPIVLIRCLENELVNFAILLSKD